MTDNTPSDNSDYQGAATVSQWHRISPIAVIYYALRFVRGFVGNMAYLLPALLVGYNQIQKNPQAALPLSIAILALIIVSSILSYWFFQYRLSNDHLEIRSGVFSKKYLNLPFNRIQNVEVSHPWYYRPFGYATLKLDSAGSAQQEANIAALEKHFAEQLRREIVRHKASDNRQSATTTTNEQGLAGEQSASLEGEVVLNRRSISDIVLHGISNNRVWIVLGALAPFIDNLTKGIPEYLQAKGIDIDQIVSSAHMPWWQLTLAVITLVIIVMAIMSLISVIGAIITFYDFSLSKADSKYIRRSGLFSRHEITMPHSRMQMVTCQQDWLDKLFKRINIKFEQMNANAANQGQPSLSEGTNKIIVPSVTAEQRDFLVADAYPQSQLPAINFQPIQRRYLLRLYLLLALIAIPLLTLLAVADKTMPLLITSLLSVFLSVVIFMRYRRWGIATDNHYIYVRKGCFGVDYHIFEAYKLQQVKIKQSIWQKRHQLASVQFVLASGSVTVPYIKEELAKTIADFALFEVERQPRSWM
ncbi:PH domain-containing protein [Thalassotalea mangrovi]|uniref:YdbS-like PH domain-containing protein n=1 Tax=Thalassotalea mangrovi TaxID=2572245 RepID=A0A4U1B8T8_9GAMM|nr:PH domain-containing protein [Thalassotalea mangrovi]TKB46376.1 hypothetical protein E8M12_04805 [Thalassotalea mangrovi]